MRKLEAGMRVELLDVIRGIAASTVVIHHVLRSTPGLDGADFWSNPASDQIWVRFAFLGDLAVTLFFVLSGTSLAISLLNHDLRLSISTFYIKRFFRIYPLFLLLILIYFLFRPIYALLVSSPPSDWLSPQFTNPISLRTWAAYLTMSFNVVDVPTVFTNVLWSLPIEFQFYLFFPLLVALYLVRGPVRGTILIVLFCAVGIVVNSVFNLPGRTVGRLWEFGGGVILGLNMNLFLTYCQRVRWRIVFGVTAILLFVLSRLMTGLPIPLAPSNSLDVFFAFTVVLLAMSFANWHPADRIGNMLVRIGWWSYSIYLTHCLWLGIWTPIFLKFNLSPVIHSVLLFLIVFPLTVWISSMLYAYFERPFIDLGRRTSRRVSQLSTAVHV